MFAPRSSIQIVSLVRMSSLFNLRSISNAIHNFEGPFASWCGFESNLPFTGAFEWLRLISAIFSMPSIGSTARISTAPPLSRVDRLKQWYIPYVNLTKQVPAFMYIGSLHSVRRPPNEYEAWSSTPRYASVSTIIPFTTVSSILLHRYFPSNRFDKSIVEWISKNSSPSRWHVEAQMSSADLKYFESSTEPESDFRFAVFNAIQVFEIEIFWITKNIDNVWRLRQPRWSVWVETDTSRVAFEISNLFVDKIDIRLQLGHIEVASHRRPKVTIQNLF